MTASRSGAILLAHRLVDLIETRRVSFEVALSAELLENRNPTRQRGMSLDQVFLAHASGYEKSATSKRVSEEPTAIDRQQGLPR